MAQAHVLPRSWSCPTLLTAGYLYLIAADQYESEAHFLVRTTAPQADGGHRRQPGASAWRPGLSSAQGEAMSVADYLTSHDVVATLRKQDRLVERFHDRDADFFSACARPTRPTNGCWLITASR